MRLFKEYCYVFVLLCCLQLPYEVCGREEAGVMQTTTSGFIFIENAGQIIDQHGYHRNDIDFKLEGNGITIFIGEGSLHYQWINRGDSSTQFYRIDATLVGANTNATVIKENATGYYENYYLPQCRNGATAKAYTRITYKDIYPNIDWVLYTNGNNLKYDFVVHPGGNINDISIRYEGATELKLDGGNLIINSPFGSVTEQAPYSYDAITKNEIPSSFLLEDNVLKYNVAAVDVYNDIVIDPSLSWATYYGGFEDETFAHHATDSAGNIYLAGNTQSINNIATTGAFQDSNASILTGITMPYDILLVKFDSNGTRQWATYYGGVQNDEPHDLCIDADNNIYIASTTTSDSLATPGAQQDTTNATPATPDGLLIKFRPDGMRIWATYFGGNGIDIMNSITVGANNDIFICGETRDGGGIAKSDKLATPGAYQDTLYFQSTPGNNDANGFLAKFNSNGVLKWCTYYPANFLDIANDKSGNLYLAGSVGIYNRPGRDSLVSSHGAHQTNFGGANETDGVLVKFDTAGHRKWATLYGGPNEDQAYGVNCDAEGNVYIVGVTSSYTNIAHGNVHQTSMSGVLDGFLAKFDSSGKRGWATYYGGGAVDIIYDVQPGSDNKIYVSGSTNSTTGIATASAYQSAAGGSFDAFMAIFTTNGQLKYGSYFGGKDQEGYSTNNNASGRLRNSINLTPKGELILSGFTRSDSAIATAGTHQDTLGGDRDLYLAKFILDTAAYIKLPLSADTFCTGDILFISYGTIQSFRNNNNFTVQLSDRYGSFTSNTTILATVNASTAGTIGCPIPGSVAQGTQYRVRIISTAPLDTSVDNGKDIVIYPYPQNFTDSSNSPVCEGDTLYLFSSSSTGGTSYYWRGPAGFASFSKNNSIPDVPLSASGDYTITATNGRCSIRDTINVVVKPTPELPLVTSNSPLCSGDTLHLAANSLTPGARYYWSGVSSFSDSVQSPEILNIKTEQGGIYKVTAELDGCLSDSASTDVVVYTTPAPGISTNSPLCEGDTLFLYSSDTVQTAQYRWEGPQGVRFTTKNANLQGATLLAKGIYTLQIDNSGCISTDSAVVNVIAYPGEITAGSNSPVCEGDTLALTATDTSTMVSYLWTGPSGYTSTLKSPVIPSVSITAKGTYLIESSRELCKTMDSIDIMVKPSPEVPLASSNSPVAIGSTLQLVFPNPTPGASTYWQGPAGFSSTMQEPFIPNIQRVHEGSYTISTELDGCLSAAVTIVVVHENRDTGKLFIYPNPNDGSFILAGYVYDNNKIALDITAITGQIIHKQDIYPVNMRVFEKVMMDGKLPGGIYFVKFILNGKGIVIPLSVVR